MLEYWSLNIKDILLTRCGLFPIRYLRLFGYNMRGQNCCSWLKIGDRVQCGKSCLGVYCKVHLAAIRKKGRVSVPCRCCGKGVLSQIQICRACGRDKVRHQHIALESRCRRQFKLVLDQVLEHSIRERSCE